MAMFGSTKRQTTAAALGAALSLVALQSAQAFNAPSNIKIDGGPLGALELSGGVDGYFYGLSGTGNTANPGLLGTDKATGAEFLNGLVDLQKTSGLVQFNIEVGATTSLTLGSAPTRTSVQTFSTGALYAGYVTLAPTSNFTISGGQLGSLEGFESGIDWNNSNLLTTDLFSVENSQSRGVSATYTQGPVSASVTFGDGFDTGVFNFLQALATYTFNSDNALSVFGATNLSRTGLNANTYGNANVPYNHMTVATYGANYINSTMIGAYYSYTVGNLNLVPEVQYVYAKVDHKIGLDKFSSNFGAALFADYSFAKSPYSIGAWGEYFSSNGPDYWFVNPGAEGIGVSVSPTWQNKNLFVRGDVGLLHLTKFSNNGNRGYGNDGGSRNQADFLLEAGVLF
ncbi:MAG: outer membrane beta-barrel protein [Acidiphilium sp.]